MQSNHKQMDVQQTRKVEAQAPDEDVEDLRCRGKAQEVGIIEAKDRSRERIY